MKNKIYVSKPLSPALEEFIPYLESIWRSSIFTNKGKYHQKFEEELSEYLGVKHISLVSNGTLALMVAIKALNLKKEIITTPFTYIATANSIKWAGAIPVFVDIDPTTFNIDPLQIKKAVTKNTCGIMPVHAYGNIADVKDINKIAKENNLKIIYDAAPCFGVEDNIGSILRHGDISTLSFHATKVLNTFEGGAIISKNKKIKDEVDSIINFGVNNNERFINIGLNAKMSEVNAAFGLVQLKHIKKSIESRKNIFNRYFNSLKSVKGIEIITSNNEDIKSNYSYFPILIKKSFPLSRDALLKELEKEGIYAKKYYYPLITNLDIYSDNKSSKLSLKNAKYSSQRVLCLPIYSDLKNEDVDRVIFSISKNIQVLKRDK